MMHPVDRSKDVAGMRSGGRAFAALLLITLAVWRVDVNFFWRDDWNFLDDMREVTTGYFFEDHFGHVSPLFKISFYLQLMAFGTNTIFYSYFNLLFVALASYATLRLLLSLTNALSAWVTTIILLLHPIMFNHVGWTFEQCVSQHLFFQILAVGYFFRWVGSLRSTDLFATIAFTIVQNYFFGNGLFVPLLFAAGCPLLLPREAWLRTSMLFLILFVGFVLVQIFLGGDRAGTPGSLSDLLGIFTGGLYLLGLDTARVFFIHERAVGWLTPWLSGGAFFTLVLLAVTRGDRDPRKAWFHVLWFLITFCSVPIVRKGDLVGQVVPHYYTILCMVPLGLVAEHALGGRTFWSWLPKGLLVAGSVVVLVGVFLLDRQLMSMVSFRSFRNEQAMMQSLQDGTPYKGFDEPYFRAGVDKVEDPLAIYRYWRERDRFRMPLGYANDPTNWTRTTPLIERE